MSSILDALKKSEAERQRGVPPTLNTPILHRGQPAKSGRPAWLLPAVAAAALVLAWAGGLFSSGDDSGEEAPTANTVATVPAEAPTPAAQTTAAPAPAPEPVTPPAPEASAPPVVNADDAPSESQRRVGFGPFPARPSTSSATAEPVAPAQADAKPDSDLAATAEATASPAAPVPEAPVDARPAPPPSATTSAATTPTATATPSGGVPTFNELPYAVRREVPPLALTLHMFSADPERRFAIINGVRVTDGQPIEGGVDVKEIRPNGVLVRYKDTDFLLPSRS